MKCKLTPLRLNELLGAPFDYSGLHSASLSSSFGFFILNALCSARVNSGVRRLRFILICYSGEVVAPEGAEEET
jgi:hypothetical protein